MALWPFTHLLRVYYLSTLRTLAVYSLRMCNSSHRPAESKGKQNRTRHKAVRGCGTALTAHPDVQRAVTKLCSVKRVNVGKVTLKLDSIFEENTRRAATRRDLKRKDEEAAAMHKIAKKAVSFNNALEEPLASSIGDLP